MMHVRGRYADAAELIRQELALYPPNAEVHSPLLLPLKIRFIHHQMFYRPVTELWPQMADLLNCCDRTQDPESYGDILFMLGGNLGTLRGNYQESRRFLVRAIAHAKQQRDHYILARSLRKYGDFLRDRGHFNFARNVLLDALRLSGRGRGTRQRSTFSVALAIWSDKGRTMLLHQSTLTELSSWRGQPSFQAGSAICISD